MLLVMIGWNKPVLILSRELDSRFTLSSATDALQYEYCKVTRITLDDQVLLHLLEEGPTSSEQRIRCAGDVPICIAW